TIIFQSKKSKSRKTNAVAKIAVAWRGIGERERVCRGKTVGGRGRAAKRPWVYQSAYPFPRRLSLCIG
ncbi:MAG: hypothetical protein NC120_13520, partial [Ruminococcus sp.]|nr:hypothetical protein [Ruminococcus sp.]